MLLAFSAPVSFASDGPETTKDCVVHVEDALEVSIQVNEVKDVSFLETSFVKPILVSDNVAIKNEVHLFVADTDYAVLRNYDKYKLLADYRKRLINTWRFASLLC